MSELEKFKSATIFEKYLIVSNLLLSKNYILLSLIYLFESLRYYCSDRFEKQNFVCKREKHKDNQYNINQEVISFITQRDIRDYRPNCYDKNYKNLYNSNIKNFQKIAKEYKSLKNLRNSLTHVNSTKQSSNITKQLKEQLKEQLKNISKLIEDDILQNLSTKSKERKVKNFFKNS